MKGAVKCFHCCCSTKLHLFSRAWETVSLDGEIPALLSSLCLRVRFPAGTAICSPSWDLCVCVWVWERWRPNRSGIMPVYGIHHDAGCCLLAWFGLHVLQLIKRHKCLAALASRFPPFLHVTECVCIEIWSIYKFSSWLTHFVFLIKGSYGVVKLAYNEDDNTYYVSDATHSHDLARV